MIGRGPKTRLGQSFVLGEGVRAARALKNDGTYLHRSIGETLVSAGDTGFVIEIVNFCDDTYYTVEFIERAVVLAARARDLESFDSTATAQP